MTFVMSSLLMALKKGLQLFQRIPEETPSCFAAGVSYEKNLGENCFGGQKQGTINFENFFEVPRA